MSGSHIGGQKDDPAMSEPRIGGRKGDPGMSGSCIGGQKGDSSWNCAAILGLMRVSAFVKVRSGRRRDRNCAPTRLGNREVYSLRRL